MHWLTFSLITCLVLCGIGAQAAEQAGRYERALSLPRRTESKVFRDSVLPRWLPGNQSFWYRVRTGPELHEFVHVDACTGKIRRATSANDLGLPAAERLATSNGRALEPKRTTYTGDPSVVRLTNSMSEPAEIYWVTTRGERRSYGRVQPGQTRDFNTYAGHVWLATDQAGNVLGFFEAGPLLLEIELDGMAAPTERGPGLPKGDVSPGTSPDGQWTVRLSNHNVVLTSADGKSTTLSTEGVALRGYRGPITWAPDSRHCVVLLVHDVARREVAVVESSPRDQLQPKLLKFDYLKPGDDLPRVQPVVIRVADKSLQVIDDELYSNNFTPAGSLAIRWSPAGNEFYFNYNQRGHQLYRILAVDPVSGQVRIVVEERSRTFIDYNQKTWREWLDKTGELLWMSERNGWAHLWLYDVARGQVKNQVTRGRWVVRRVLRVDAKKRQVWFLAGGVRSGEDPYHRHLCRVGFDGSGFVQLTEGDGDHSVDFSPDGQWFIARWSRVDHPTVTELRRSTDGSLVCVLEQADIASLVAAGWSVPERFVAKGRDGQTDIYGILIKPADFDPEKKYPIVEQVYAGPHSAFAPKSFDRLTRQHVLAELGCIVVQVDGMGTNHRGKTFHDVCWKNLEDAGFADRIAWIKAAAETRPWMDLSRVGIYGGSAGGQTAMRALIDHPDFYRVAVADCGCHDNRMDKIWWNEQWLGWPVDEAYLRASNVEHAGRMQGQLLLIVGELDTNVDPASTMQVVHALQQAGKHFEFMPIVGTGHGAAETPYGSLRRIDFLMRHLLNSPPDEPLP